MDCLKEPIRTLVKENVDLAVSDIYYHDKDFSKLIPENEIRQKVILARIAIMDKIILLQDTIYLKFEGIVEDDTESAIGLRCKRVPENDMLMLCLETESIRALLHHMAIRYKFTILSVPYEQDTMVHSIIISVRKICVGKWKLHFATSYEPFLTEVIDCLQEFNCTEIIGSSHVCKLILQNIDSIQPFVLGGDMGFKITNGNTTIIKKVICFAQFLIPIFCNSIPTIVFDSIKPHELVTRQPSTTTNIKTIICDLQFSKREIACIIGRKGSRLSMIRESSGCRIKVTPIPLEIINSTLHKDIIQTITLLGSSESIEKAVNIINETIKCYRNSPAKFI